MLLDFLTLPAGNSDQEGTFMQVRVADESQMTAAMASDSEQDQNQSPKPLNPCKLLQTLVSLCKPA